MYAFRRKGGNLPPLSFTEMERHQPGGRLNSLAKDAARPSRWAGDHLDRRGLATDERARFKQFERENVELRRANEILRLASAYFAKAELDRRAK